MKRHLLTRLLFRCSHQFTWPRRDDSGGYYQLCVNCGSKYKYDWKSMRRTARVEDDLPETRKSHRPTKPTWVARERRLRHVVPVLYRVAGTTEWLQGDSENLSRSGLLFRGSTEVELGSRVEVQLEMPPELAGDEASEVICTGSVARVTRDPAAPKGIFLIACAVEDYNFEQKSLWRAAGAD
jgi:PilZ domain-containing protein